MTPKPKTYRVLIIRPLMLHEQFTQELGAALQLKPELVPLHSDFDRLNRGSK
jgi:hypothetical protein